MVDQVKGFPEIYTDIAHPNLML